MQRLKRVFKSATDENVAGGKRKLHLEDTPPQKRSEVQVYMALYYETRIREVVKQRWAAAGISNMDFGGQEIPEDQVDPEESSVFKDTKIPLFYKNMVAQGLYEAEEEAIKAHVRLVREEEHQIKTVYNTTSTERIELVREYQRYATDFSLYV